MTFVMLLALVAACSQEEILPGERIGVREALEIDGAGDAAGAVNRAVPINLPAPVALAEWPQRAGSASHAVPHAALNATLTRVWSVSIGAGDSRKYKITADPVVGGGRVYTLDSRSAVRAFSTSGDLLWSADLTPASERNQDATGGGLAYENGQVFATTGFGALAALDAATGEIQWTQRTDSAVTAAPAVKDGIVYVVSRDNQAWAVKAEDGRVQWQLPGTPSPSGLLGGAAPAVSDRLAIFPFASSEVVATLRKSGIRVWGASVAGQRRGRVYARVTDITGDPVINGDVVYVGNQSGRVAAMRAAGGARIWTAEEGAYGPVWPAGGSVFLVSDQGELVRLDAETGERIWGVPLPYFTKQKPKRFKAIHANHGPVLAGGRLLVASDDGLIRSFNPVDGTLVSTVELPGGATTSPVVAGGTLYVVSSKGQLHAFR
ncbi:PQQ-like beta-propeller repeat protein [Actibacterium ureilyticum]|uniref:PQQ-like beta-propeller repeat protein n=1 Tax=Actibacterium ureilyticum TaxID=1590614 RepID=UPI000BAB1BAD|nr:PQQ-like beta-propeller repeat protein [Actibacterium ureilyticum]